MIFLGHCPDNVGLVAKICKFFCATGINITNLEEHTEARRFFIHIEAQVLEEDRQIASVGIRMDWQGDQYGFSFFD